MGLPSNTNALQNGFAQGYQIGRSLRFRSSASAYLNRTLGTPTSGTTWTWSGWVKRGALGSLMGLQHAYSATNNQGGIFFSSSGDTLTVIDYPTSVNCNLVTTQVFRDPSAWYHIIVATDTTQATASNRVKLYVNGVQVTAFGTSTYPTQNTTFRMVASGNSGSVGRYYDGTSYYFDGYLAEVNFIDGQALTPSSFGVYDSNGIWQPIKYTGTYGTNGFYLPFSNTTSTTTLVADASGNGNNWTANNISLTAGTTYDSMLDSPTVSNASSNYAVLNPLKTLSQVTLSNANLGITFSATTTIYQQAFGTIGVSSGKWYFEFVTNSITGVGGGQFSVGVAKIDAIYNANNFVSGNGWVYYGYNGYKYNTSGIAYGSTFGINDVIGVALDMDAGKIWFSKNNTWQASGDPVAGTNPAFTNLAGNTVVPFVTDDLSNDTKVGNINFGQRPFSYTPPSGYNALNTANLPQPLISNGANYMAATLITGTGGSQTLNNGTNTTIGTTFQPDLVWWKSRSNVTNNILVNSITGVNPFLRSNTTGAEDTPSGMTSFNSNGFSVNGSFDNTYTFVAWQWLAGAGTTSTNTSGSITSTVSVSAQSGFSIATYTGTGANATVGHGLGTVPSFMIIKNRSSGTTDWRVWSSSFSAPTTGYLALNTTAAGANATTMWNSSLPTSSVINLGSSNSVNGSGNNIISYCFSVVRGFSAFGSYTGNGSADGTFVFTNFRSRFVMLKRTDTTGNWFIFDTSRDTYNVTINELYPNLSNAEGVGTTDLDILSNGFKLRASSAGINASGGTYIYAAFAENPFQIARAR